MLVVLPFRTAKESVALGNNSNYGLAASVWTENVSLALEVAISLKAGTVWVNCHNLFDAAAGFGGYKHSGYGRDGGKEVQMKTNFLMPNKIAPSHAALMREQVSPAHGNNALK